MRSWLHGSGDWRRRGLTRTRGVLVAWLLTTAGAVGYGQAYQIVALDRTGSAVAWFAPAEHLLVAVGQAVPSCGNLALCHRAALTTARLNALRGLAAVYDVPASDITFLQGLIELQLGPYSTASDSVWVVLRVDLPNSSTSTPRSLPASP